MKSKVKSLKLKAMRLTPAFSFQLSIFNLNDRWECL